MLTEDDKALIRSTRDEIVAGREFETFLIRETESAKDPYTGESKTVEVIDTVVAVWGSAANGTRVHGNIRIKEGYTVEVGDLHVSFKDSVNMDNVAYCMRDDGIRYKFITISKVGMGGVNRYECQVRRVT